MKYPGVIFFRQPKYDFIDKFIEINHNKFICNFKIISDPSGLNNIFNPNYPVLVTFGELDDYLKIVNIPSRFRKRWLHFNDIKDIDKFNNSVNYNFMNNILNINNNSPSVSIFTTCYKSYEKIKRAYNSLKKQSFIDWEWVILDDSPEEQHFSYLTNYFNQDADNRIRLYKRCQNSGNIGNVKNEAVMLCRGKYVVEFDHDDELTEDALKQIYSAFESDINVGFVYMNFANIYENGNNFSYGNHFGLGYEGYYCQKINGKWLYIASSANINNVTASNIVAVPNHPRCWRKDFLISIGNYSELLPISDDYELLLRTFMSKTKIIKINELGYIQYMNDNNNNFSLIRNSEINRLCRDFIYPAYLEKGLNETMKDMGCCENYDTSQIWKRINYNHKYCNKIFGNEKQIVYIGFETLFQEIDKKSFKRDSTCEYIVLDNNLSIKTMECLLDYYKLDFFKFYCLKNCSEEELVNYHKLLLANDNNNYEIIYRETKNIKPIKTISFLKNENIDKNLNKNIKITIITPSIRPDNLLKISESLNFDYISNWIIVYDSMKIKENPLLFKDNIKITELLYGNENSISGNAQRNYGLNFIDKSNETYVYFLDDDLCLTNEIYQLFNNLESEKIYTFGQERSADVFPYVNVLRGDVPEVYLIDTAQFLISSKLINNEKWIETKYNSDGYFIRECIKNNQNSWIFVDDILVSYNNI